MGLVVFVLFCRLLVLKIWFALFGFGCVVRFVVFFWGFDFLLFLFCRCCVLVLYLFLFCWFCFCWLFVVCLC